MIGKKVLHYEITEELGRGGMGVVYKATDTKLKRTVALKFLPLTVGPEERARFDVEAQSVAHLQHPNICGIHEINEIDGQAFIVMPYLDGTALNNLTAAGPMDIPETVEIAVQVANALHDAHEHDIVHRDIKAANVIVTRKGLVKVMDFGLAKRQGSTRITQAGTTLGTIEYMSPEQAGGKDADHRSDIWSLGVLLYEMLAGVTPFRDKFDQATIYSILNKDPKPIASLRKGVPDRLSEVVNRAMTKDPDERYQRVSDMLADLLEVQDEVGVPSSIGGSVASVMARPTTAGGRKPTTARTHPRTAAATPDGRRLAIVVGLYAAAAILLVVGLRWTVNHFPVSPHLPGFAFAALLALLPAVIVLAYFRRGHILKKVGVPLYILAAAAVMFFAFQDKDLGAATETVRITDEDGNTIEREMPKGQFRKRLAIFYLDNKTGDPALDWLSYGIAQMLRYDLYQDTYMSFGLGFTTAHRDAGYAKPVGSPLSLKRRFAGEGHLPRFLAGSFNLDRDEFVVDVTLYDTGSGRSLAEHRHRGESIAAVVDTMSVQLRRDLGVPDYHIEENPDLPVAEMFTASLEALEHYVNAVNSIYQDNDFERAVAELEAAVGIDPAFAMAYWLLSDSYTGLNRGEQAQEAMRQALKHAYRLPENEQYSLKSDYHEQRQDAEAMFENAKRWAALHPESAGAHETLAGHYERAGDIEAAITEREILFEVDPQRYWELHSIGRLYEILGNNEEALNHYQKYLDLHPDKRDSYTTIGRFYSRRGEYDRARDYYKKALLVEPESVSIRASLAEIERHIGDFPASLEQCEDALATARSASDSSTAYWQLTRYYRFRGQAARALEAQVAALEQMRKTQPMIVVMITELFALGTYVEAGRFDEAIAILRSAEEQVDVAFLKPIISAAYIMVYAINEDPSYLPEAEKHTKAFEEWASASGRQDLNWARGVSWSLVEYWRGNYEASLDHLIRALDATNSTEIENKLLILMSAAEVAGESEDYAAAFDYLDQLFELEPFSPEGHLEAARIYEAQGQIEKAIEHLEKALRVWENADPEHPRAKRARELARRLKLSS